MNQRRRRRRRVNKGELKNILECLLFISDKPLTSKKIVGVTGIEDENKIQSAMRSLKKDYDDRNSSLQVSTIAGGYQLSTKKEFSKWVRKLYEQQVTYRLSASALETLSVIAYKQPVTRVEIEKVRGVDVSGVLRSLLDKKLIKVAGKKDAIGRPSLYRTTDNFLMYFGLKDISDMPDIDEIGTEAEEAEAAEGIEEKQE